MDEEAAADAAILRNLRSHLTEAPSDDIPVAVVVEQKKKWIGMLTNKLNACTSNLPTPDEMIVKQIAIFAEMQVIKMNLLTQVTDILQNSILVCSIATLNNK